MKYSYTVFLLHLMGLWIGDGEVFGESDLSL